MTLKEFNKTQGRCPFCGSDDFVFDVTVDDEPPVPKLGIEMDELRTGCIDHVYTECQCMVCGCEFRQLYELRYAGQEIKTKGLI